MLHRVNNDLGHNAMGNKELKRCLKQYSCETNLGGSCKEEAVIEPSFKESLKHHSIDAEVRRAFQGTRRHGAWENGCRFGCVWHEIVK